MFNKPCDVIVLRTWEAQHIQKGGYWRSWYLDNVIGNGSADEIRARVRKYWRGDCIDAFLVPDRATAEDIALTYNGPHGERVRYVAACLAIGENPDDGGDGGERVIADVPAPQLPPSGGTVLDELLAH